MNVEALSGIQLYHFSRENCHYGLLSMTSGTNTGWGECIIAVDVPYFDIVPWANFLFQLNKLSLAEARHTALENRNVWGDTKTGLVLMTLSNLSSKAAAEEEQPDPDILFQTSRSYLSVL